MNPKEFGWEANEQVTVINSTDEAFRFQVNAKLYEVGAGQKAKMAGHIAWLYCYKLAQKIALSTNIERDKDGRNKTSDFQHWNDEGFRQKLYNKLVVGRENAVTVISDEEEPETFDEPPETFEDADETQEDDVTEPQEGDVSTQTKVKPMKRKVAKRK